MSQPPTTVIIGQARRNKLIAFGFPQGLLDALDDPASDPITSLVAASNGEVLAEIKDYDGVRQALPSGRIVPLVHVYESDLTYYLLLESDESSEFVYWSPEVTTPMEGGVYGYLTEIVVRAWEGGADSDALVAWCERIQHPASDRIVEALATAETQGTRRTHEDEARWRRSFLASIRE